MQRTNLNRWENNDERQKIPPTGPRPIRWRLGHVVPVHPAGRDDLWDAPPVPLPPILTVSHPDGSGESTNLDQPHRPTQPDLPNPTPPPATSSCGTSGTGSNEPVGLPPKAPPACRDRGRRRQEHKGGDTCRNFQKWSEPGVFCTF